MVRSKGGVMTQGHPDLDEWIGSGTTVATGSEQAELVADHLRVCTLCAAEATRLQAAAALLGAAAPATAPAHLRPRVLAAALARRPSRQRLSEPFERQVDALAELLSELDTRQLELALPRYGTVSGLIEHLAGNDGLVAIDLGLGGVGRAGTSPHEWHEQARGLLRGVQSDASLDQPVRMAGRTPQWRPLRDALVQRAFETWIHADDVRRAVGRPSSPPPPEDLSAIVALGVRLLPLALRSLGRDRPGQRAALHLAGAAPGSWSVPLANDAGAGVEVVALRAEAVAFCELMASRRDAGSFAYEADGDQGAAADLLAAAATLGCD
jgi:uncharacterized protein (TIGR03083 family)